MYSLKAFLVLAFLTTAFTISAQKIRSEKITYQYLRLPSQPLDKQYTSYRIIIDAPYEKKNATLTRDYLHNKKQARDKYIKDSLDYLVAVKAADEQYEKEMEEYKKKTVGTRLVEKAVLGENTKPVKRTPSMPYMQHVEEPVLQTQYDHKLLADTYLKLHGFNEQADRAIDIVITLFGYDYTQPRVLSEQKDMISTGKTTSTYKATYYHTEFSYRHPMALKVTTPDGKELLNITPQELNIYQVYKTPATDNQVSVNRELLVKSKEEQVLQQNLAFINDLLNDKFGYSPVKREAELYFVKSKSDEYADLTQAFNEASSALQMLVADSASAKQNLSKVAGMLNSALRESDPGNKNARINKDVTIAVLFNLLEVYFALGDTANGFSTITKLNALSLDNSERKTKTAFELAFNDLNKRQKSQ